MMFHVKRGFDGLGRLTYFLEQSTYPDNQRQQNIWIFIVSTSSL